MVGCREDNGGKWKKKTLQRPFNLQPQSSPRWSQRQSQSERHQPWEGMALPFPPHCQNFWGKGGNLFFVIFFVCFSFLLFEIQGVLMWRIGRTFEKQDHLETLPWEQIASWLVCPVCTISPALPSTSFLILHCHCQKKPLPLDNRAVFLSFFLFNDKYFQKG